MTRIRMVSSLAPALLAVALFVGCDDGSDGSDGTGGTGGAVTADGGIGAGGTGGAGGAAEVTLQSLEIAASDDLTRYNDVQLTVTAVMSDGTRQEVAEGVTWATSDDAITTVTAAGEAHGVKMGPATVTATFEGISATWETEVGCRYPNFPDAVRFNNTMPALGWNDAHNPDGSQFRFTMEDFYCAEEYDQYTSMIMMIKAAWCAPCTAYAQQRLNPAAAGLIDDGALIIYVEAQDLDGVPADSAYAFNHMRRIIGDGLGIRVGDASTMATIPSEISLPAYLQQTDLVVAFPTILIVRRRDMKVIAESARTRLSLPLERIVNDLEADYSEITVEFVNQCAEGDEEASEPNDDQATAETVGVGTYEAGICAAAPDVYEIDIDGPWRATVNFTHATGDIDIAVYPPNSEQAEASSLSGDDNEMVEFQGRAFLTIFGFNGASAPYTLNVEAL